MDYQVNLKGLFLFELRSWLGRNFFQKKPKLFHGKNYLNLGCGNRIVSRYINADMFYGFKFLREDKLDLQWQLDLRYKLSCNSDIFDGIYSEHTLEHLYPNQAQNLLLELHRVMKSGSIIRITVPDIEKYVDFYSANYKNLDIDRFNEKYCSGCSAIRNITQNYFHVSTWNLQELKKYLKNAGFIDIKRMSYGKTQDERLRLDLESRAYEALYIEAKK